MITVLYFARLREALGVPSERIELASGATLGALRAQLVARGGAWAVELADGRAVRMAVNQTIAAADTVLREGDEVAFFPPVTGG